MKSVIKTRDDFLNRKYNEHKETYQNGVIRDLTDALIKALEDEGKEDSKALNKITEDHVVLTMADAFSAGFETTSTTITWFLLYMARHQDIQSKVQEELDTVIGQGSCPSWTDRTKLNYTFATIEETNRLSSVGPLLVPRKTTRDTSLEGYTIPKDTTIFINAWALHHDENEWDEPHVFNPERFLDQNGNLIQVAGVKSFLPFGAGRRVCVGEVLARQEMFLMLSRLLQKFRIEADVNEPPPAMDGEMLGLTLNPKPFKVSFKQRYQT